MKKFYYFLLLFISFIAVNGQIVNIPDANFKAKLLEASPSNDIASNSVGARIKIDTNNDGEIQFDEALQVFRLSIQQSEINNLIGIEAFTNLFWLYCGNNNLVNVNDLIGLPALVNLQCPGNEFTLLDLSVLPNLQLLNIAGNLNMTSVNFTGLENLTTLLCSYNPAIRNLDFSELTRLGYLEFSSNENVRELDLSSNYYLNDLSINGTPLSYLNIKNGSNFFSLSDFASWDVPENIFMCIDPSDLNGFNFQYLPDSSSLTVYCAEYPGAGYNTITGNLFFDSNNDSSCDGEDNFDFSNSFLKINISDGIEEFYTFTNDQGGYKFYTQEGSYTISQKITENSEFFIVEPNEVEIYFEEANGSTQTQNFCITPNGNHPDVEIIISPLEPARPGFEATYKVVYRNKGNQTVSGNINFEFNDDLLDFNSSNPTAENQSTGLLNYNFTELYPFETREITLSFEVNTPTENPPVNIGDWLSFQAEIEIPNDINLNDNEFTFRQEVVGSYDPNDILCLEGTPVSPEMIGEELHYRIRFENTGNFPAERVVVAMGINSEEYDISSFQLLNTSHQVQARIVNDVAEFFFEEINLGPNEEGDILFSMKSLETLSVGDAVMSYADIYFDYNYPITTNEAETIFEILGLDESNSNVEITIYPNPVQDNFNIKSNSKINKIELYDVAGRLLKVSLVNKFESNQNISSFSAGTYFVKIYTKKGITAQKIIKQ